ncbi:MAG: 3-deoxy-D-manno-octulosonic acid transferase, partial [Sideroxydans sp.]
VLIGPHTYNFAQAAELAIACGSTVRVKDASDLISQLDAILKDPHRSKGMAQAGLHFVSDNQGATIHSSRLIDGALLQKA